MSATTSGNAKIARERRLGDPDFQAALTERALTVTVLLAVLCAVFAVHDAWVWTHPVQPRYFYIDGKTPPRPAVALDSPIVDDTELLEWTVKWTIAPYNVNYHDFPVQLNDAGRHYTVHGWNTFAEQYIKNGNFDKMKQARLLCYAQPTRAAIIKATTVENGRLSYVVQLPIVQTCENSNQQNTQALLITANVQRVDDHDHPDGLAISQLNASLQ